MAKKEETISLIDTFSEFKELKNIDRTTMVSVLEESFRSVIAKMFGTDENYDVIVNPDKGDFEIWRNREVVADEDLTNPNMQISLTEAQKIDASYEVGEEVTDEVIFAKFGRRAILNLRQTLASKILELEKDSLYNKYIDRVGTVISAEVYQIWKKEMLLLDDEGNELLLPKTEQIPSDFYRKGETARAVVARVDNKNNNPKIILSRTSPVFLQRLFEMEVPEINDGLITIKKIARIPGERAKIAVESYDDRIDPVGACVGVKGSRIHGIVRELRNENIDVINYTSNIQLFIQRALSPAKISSIVLHEEEKKAEVYLKPEEVQPDSKWAALRDAQAHALHLPNTGMACAIDLGEAYDIHPKNKQEVGKRLAQAALAKTYNKGTYEVPAFLGYRISGRTLILSFDQEVVAKERAPKGFILAGPDGKYVPAQATIRGKEVILQSDQIEIPTAACYAWADNPVCNLYGKSGLPVPPFRTRE